MTLANPVNVATFTGNGVTTVFPYTFKIPGASATDQSNVEVTLFTIATGVEGAPLALGLWSITGVGTDTYGNVTYTGGGTPLPATQKLNIRRVMPYEQELDLTTQSAYFPELLEAQLDLIVMQIQQLAEESDRSVKTVLGSGTDPAVLIASLTASSAAAVAASAAATASAAAAAASAAAAATFDPSNYIASSLLTTRGDIITRNATIPQRLALGTTGQVLKSDGTDVVWGAGSASALGIQNGQIVASVAGSALTLALKGYDGNDPSASNPVYVAFGSATANDGDITIRTITAATSLVISSGSTLGAPTGSVPFVVWSTLFDDAGTVRIGAMVATTLVSGALLQHPLAAWAVASSTAEGGAGAADSAQTFYTGTAVATKPYVVAARHSFETGLAAAGTWASAPTRTRQFDNDVPLPGRTVQVVATSTGAVATGITVLPGDDTIPQITEGDQYMSQAITPASAANILNMHYIVFMSNSAANGYHAAALFQDAVANALAVAAQFVNLVGALQNLKARHAMIAATTSATTMRIRAGNSVAGTTTFNGGSGARLYGGVLVSSLMIEEIAS